MGVLSFFVTLSLFLSTLVNAAVLDRRSTTCNAANIAVVKQQVTSPVYFCTWYLSDTRTRSPLPALSVDELWEACKCITTSAAKQTLSHKITTTGTLKTCKNANVVPVKDEFKNYSAFCKFFNAYPRTTSPIRELDAKGVIHACDCIASAATTSSVKTSSTKKSSTTTKRTTSSTKKVSSSTKKTSSSIKQTTSSTRKTSSTIKPTSTSKSTSTEKTTSSTKITSSSSLKSTSTSKSSSSSKSSSVSKSSSTSSSTPVLPVVPSVRISSTFALSAPALSSSTREPSSSVQASSSPPSAIVSTTSATTELETVSITSTESASSTTDAVSESASTTESYSSSATGASPEAAASSSSTSSAVTTSSTPLCSSAPFYIQGSDSDTDADGNYITIDEDGFPYFTATDTSTATEWCLDSYNHLIVASTQLYAQQNDNERDDGSIYFLSDSDVFFYTPLSCPMDSTSLQLSCSGTYETSVVWPYDQQWHVFDTVGYFSAITLTAIYTSSSTVLSDSTSSTQSESASVSISSTAIYSSPSTSSISAASSSSTGTASDSIAAYSSSTTADLASTTDFSSGSSTASATTASDSFSSASASATPTSNGPSFCSSNTFYIQCSGSDTDADTQYISRGDGEYAYFASIDTSTADEFCLDSNGYLVITSSQEYAVQESGDIWIGFVDSDSLPYYYPLICGIDDTQLLCLSSTNGGLTSEVSKTGDGEWYVAPTVTTGYASITLTVVYS